MKRSRPPDIEAAVAAILIPKEIDVGDADVIQEAGSGFEHGTRRTRWPWTVTIKRVLRGKVEVLRADLLAPEAPPVVTLDYHVRDQDGVPRGYHWDLHPPLVHSKMRIPVVPQPSSVEEALDILASHWALRFVGGGQTLVRTTR